MHMMKSAEVEVTTQKMRFKSSEPRTVAEGKGNSSNSATHAKDAPVVNLGNFRQMTDYKRSGIYGGAGQCTPDDEQLGIATTILIVVAAENNISGQALKVADVDITNVSSLSLPRVKNARPPPPISELLPLGACDAQPSGTGAPQRGNISKSPINHWQPQ